MTKILINLNKKVVNFKNNEKVFVNFANMFLVIPLLDLLQFVL